MYYKPKVLLEKERNLQIIMAENKELLKRINIINRTTGEVDSHWRIRLQAMSNYETREREMKRITMDNYKFLQRILDTGPAVVDNVTLRKEWKKNLKTMSEMSRFPLVYICEKEGLLGDVIIPPRMRLKCRENRPK
ncbi:hypothetical protein C0J52_16315 [Blattella germanica]|nr:hypothetical protein C0J52_16315 [Blattella germanica]